MRRYLLTSLLIFALSAPPDFTFSTIIGFTATMI